MENAQTWDSYESYLNKALDYFRPKRCFEWGSGKSTKIIANHQSVETLDSVEHNPEWIDRIKPVPEEVKVIFEPNESLYPLVNGRHDKYDLIFVDGKLREKCLEIARSRLNEMGFVVLHDAEREEYKKAINLYKYYVWVDDGHTVFLCDNYEIAGELTECLRS